MGFVPVPNHIPTDWAPTPSALKSVVDELVEKFNPKAD
jgi:hypothetical protein